MTRFVLNAARQLDGHPFAQFVGLVLLLCLLLPATLIDALLALARLVFEAYWLSRATARCTRNHRVRLKGAFSCPTCKHESDQHGFAMCPHCGEVAYAIRCPCGASVPNPLWRAS
jgi:hypothetical protein